VPSHRLSICLSVGWLVPAPLFLAADGRRIFSAQRPNITPYTHTPNKGHIQQIGHAHAPTPHRNTVLRTTGTLGNTAPMAAAAAANPGNAATDGTEALAVFRPPSPLNVAHLLERWTLAGVPLEVGGEHAGASGGLQRADGGCSPLQGGLPEPMLVPAMFRRFTILPSPPSSDTTVYSFHPPSPPHLQQSLTYSSPSSAAGHDSSLPVPASCLLTQLATHTVSGTGHTDPPPTGPGLPGELRLSSSGSGAWAMAEVRRSGREGGAGGGGRGGDSGGREADTKKDDSGASAPSKATDAPSQHATGKPGSRRTSYAAIVGRDGGSPSAGSATPDPTDRSSLPLPSSLFELPRDHARLLLEDLFASLVTLAAEQPQAWGVFDTKARNQLEQPGIGSGAAAAVGVAKVAAAVLTAAKETVAATLLNAASVVTGSTIGSNSNEAAAADVAAAPATGPSPPPPSLHGQAHWIYSHLKHSLTKTANQDKWHGWKEALIPYLERLLSARTDTQRRASPPLSKSAAAGGEGAGGAAGGGEAGLCTAAVCQGASTSDSSLASADPPPPLPTHLQELNSLVLPLRQRVGRLWKRVDEAMESALIANWSQLNSAEEANEALLAALIKEGRKETGEKSKSGSGGGNSILAELKEYWQAYASCAASSCPGQVLLSGLFRNRIENWQSSLALDTNQLSFEDLVVACDESTAILTEALEGFMERYPDMMEEILAVQREGSGAIETAGERTSTTAAAAAFPTPAAAAPASSTSSSPLSRLYSVSFQHFLSSSHLLPRLFTPATFSLVRAGGRLDGRVKEKRVGPVRDVLTLRMILDGKWQEAVWRLRELAEDKEEEAWSKEWQKRERNRKGQGHTGASSSDASPLGLPPDSDDGRAEAIQADRLEEWMTKYVVAGEFVSSAKSLGGGFTTTKLVTLSPDDLLLPSSVSLSDRPVVQLLGVFKPKPRISLSDLQSMKDGLVSDHRKEVAAYRLDRLLGLNHVPLTKSIHLDECEGSLQVYVQECVAARSVSQLSLTAPRRPGKFDEPQGSRATLPRAVRLFDFLLDNRDRNVDNWLLSTLDGRVVLIDHSWSHQTPRVVKDMDMAIQGEQAIRDMLPARRMVQRMEWIMESSAQAAEAAAAAKGTSDIGKPQQEPAPTSSAPVDQAVDEPKSPKGILEKEMQFLLEPRDVDGIKHRMEMVLSYLRREVAAHGADAVFAEADAEEARLRQIRKGFVDTVQE